MKNILNIIWFLFKIIISLSILYFLFKKIEFEKILIEVKFANIGFILFVFFLLIISNILLGAYRWKIFLEQQEIKIQFYKVINLHMMGIFFSAFTPSIIGADTVRIYYLAKLTDKISKPVLATLQDRFIGFFTLVMLGMLSLILFKNISFEDKVKNFIFLIFACFITLFIILYFLKSKNKITLFLSQFKYYQKIPEIVEKIISNKTIFIKTVFLSLLMNIIFIIALFLVALSVGINIKITNLFVLVPVVSIISSIPVTIGGLGLREGSYVYFLSQLNIPEYQSLALSLIGTSLYLIICLICGVPFLYQMIRLKKIKN